MRKQLFVVLLLVSGILMCKPVICVHCCYGIVFPDSTSDKGAWQMALL